jgi:hypothetical protein
MILVQYSRPKSGVKRYACMLNVSAGHSPEMLFPLAIGQARHFYMRTEMFIDQNKASLVFTQIGNNYLELDRNKQKEQAKTTSDINVALSALIFRK